MLINEQNVKYYQAIKKGENMNLQQLHEEIQLAYDKYRDEAEKIAQDHGLLDSSTRALQANPETKSLVDEAWKRFEAKQDELNNEYFTHTNPPKKRRRLPIRKITERLCLTGRMA